MLAQSSQRQKDDFIMSYHLQQLFFFSFFLVSYFLPLCTLSFPPCFDPDDEAGRGLLHFHLDVDKGAGGLFFLFYFFIEHPHQSVSSGDLSDPTNRTFLSIAITGLLMWVGDAMV